MGWTLEEVRDFYYLPKGYIAIRDDLMKEQVKQISGYTNNLESEIKEYLEAGYTLVSIVQKPSGCKLVGPDAFVYSAILKWEYK